MNIRPYDAQVGSGEVLGLVASHHQGGAGFLGGVRGQLLEFSRSFQSKSLLVSMKELADTVAAVEDLSKVVEQLQVLGAQALDRQDIAVVGDTNPGLATIPATATESTDPASATESTGLGTGCAGSVVERSCTGLGPSRVREFRDTAEYLRARLGISRSEAKRRLRVAASVVPGIVFGGQQCPPRLEVLVLAAAARKGTLSAHAVTLIIQALERVRPAVGAGDLHAMEEHLTAQAEESDVDMLRVIIHRWEDHLDPDGREPSPALLRARQGVFLRGKRYGLHHLNIAATDEQYEQLITTMNTHTNPRTRRNSSTTNTSATSTGTADAGAASTSAAGAADAGVGDTSATSAAATGATSTSAASATCTSAGDAGAGDAGAANAGPGGQVSLHGAWAGPAGWAGPVGWDEPTREQDLLEGLVGACRIALSTAKLPATGGHRPQVMVTIDYRDLTDRLHNHNNHQNQLDDQTHQHGQGHQDQPDDQGGQGYQGHPDHAAGRVRLNEPAHAGEGVFGGLISATAIRAMACDADLIPVVLGGQGQILDVGRAQRLFPPALRRALIARDKGCAFPDCTTPAPWCEAHHITFWEHGGPTSTDQGVLLCSRHHHLIHHGNWTIESHTGIPWFTPPTYIDPHQHPRQNHYRLNWTDYAAQ